MVHRPVAEASPNRKVLLMSVVMLNLAISGVVFWFMLGDGEEVSSPPAASAPEPIAAPAPQILQPPPAPAPLQPPTRPPARPGSDDAIELPESSLRERPSDGTRNAVWSALDQRHGDSARPNHEYAEDLPNLDAEYIQAAIREQLVPVAQECYESAIEDDPELAGTIMLQFEIVGAEDVGGVVESASIQPGETTLANDGLHECMRESVMAVEFPPPEADGTVLVHYPFKFEQE